MLAFNCNFKACAGCRAASRPDWTMGRACLYICVQLPRLCSVMQITFDVRNIEKYCVTPRPTLEKRLSSIQDEALLQD